MSKEDIKFLKIQTCVLKVNIHCDGCKQKVRKLLQKIDGVYTTTIDAEQGKVTVSGNVDPSTLIKKLVKSGKHAELWSSPKGGNYNNQLNKQFQDMQMDIKGQKDSKPLKGGKDQKVPHQLLQQMKDMKPSQFKDLKLPFKDQKSVKFSLPKDEDLDDDEFDDFDEFDDEFDDVFDDEHEEMMKAQALKDLKMKAMNGHGPGIGHHPFMNGPHAMNGIKGGGGHGPGAGHTFMSGPHSMNDKKNGGQGGDGGGGPGGAYGPGPGPIAHPFMNGPHFMNDKKGGGPGPHAGHPLMNGPHPMNDKKGGGGGGGGGGGDNKTVQVPIKGGKNDGNNGNGGIKGVGNNGGGNPFTNQHQNQNQNQIGGAKNGAKVGGGNNKGAPNNACGGGNNKGAPNNACGGGNNGAQGGKKDSGPQKDKGQGFHEINLKGGGGGAPMGPMGTRNMPQMPPQGNIPAVQGLPMNMNAGGFFQGAGPDVMVGNPYQQQYLAAMMMQQQRQNGGERFQPMTYARPPPAVAYAPYAAPQHYAPSPHYSAPPHYPSAGQDFSHYFSDENTNSCAVM